MSIPRSLGWLVVTAIIVAALVGLSYLALDKPNAVWSGGTPHCPHCRKAVEMYSKRCPTCREEFDWAATPEEDSPLCSSCATRPELAQMTARAKVLGEGVVVKRVATAVSIPDDQAREWWKSFEPGRCGWCGGTGRNLGSAENGRDICPVCFGERVCIACDGEVYTRVGDEKAARALEHGLKDLEAWTTLNAPRDQFWKHLKSFDEEFVKSHPGTVEATRLLFWPAFQSVVPSHVRFPDRPLSASEARRRVTSVLAALSAD